MDQWSDAIGVACEQRLTLTQLMDICVKHHPEEPSAAVDLEDGHDSGDEWLDSTKKSTSPVDEGLKKESFLNIGSPAATLRLLQDLKNIRRLESAGFEAHPVVEPGHKVPNLYRWEIHLTDFPEPLNRQLEDYAKSTGSKKSVQLEMRFSDKYPNMPPFVRVIKPRFQAMTGHVTIGGSICMELLTITGWAAVNDIESILIQIKTEMTSGNGSLQGGGGEYDEKEAWGAFYRAAEKHGWKVDGLSSKMFPKV